VSPRGVPSFPPGLQEVLDAANKQIKAAKHQLKEAYREINWGALLLGLSQVLYWLLWCSQIVILAWFLRGVVQFFKADDLNHSCLVLIAAALVYAILQIALGSVMMFMSKSWHAGQLTCVLLPFTLVCALLQARLIVRVRGVIAEYLP
jgi:hypothetical protein